MNSKKEELRNENRLTSLEEKVDAIMTNHLPHIAEDIKGLHNKFDRGLWLAVTTCVGVVTSLLKDLLH